MKDDPFDGWVELTEKDVMSDIDITEFMLELINAEKHNS